jgi:hypothetical protein
VHTDCQHPSDSVHKVTRHKGGGHFLTCRRTGHVTAALSSYVFKGGIIITEYSTSAAIYQTVFNIVARRGAFSGPKCSGGIMPATKARDNFWTFVSFVPNAKPGCGYDLSALPGVVPLGGWSPSTVSLGYKTYGRGRVFFVESNWQDAVPKSTLPNGDDGRLMATMILGGKGRV